MHITVYIYIINKISTLYHHIFCFIIADGSVDTVLHCWKYVPCLTILVDQDLNITTNRCGFPKMEVHPVIIYLYTGIIGWMLHYKPSIFGYPRWWKPPAVAAVPTLSELLPQGHFSKGWVVRLDHGTTSGVASNCRKHIWVCLKIVYP